ncbi:restriction endonuclease subunit S [Candidatus Clostridium stratigraminis]|uniref:Restriction endonuclease subunit S n=1 Tax=Candidatus Clostridium stratigraminis TaxID=3381661 RepID=A0ABW8T790_9CLOT
MNLQDREWKDYHLYDLFEIDPGNKFDRSKMTAYMPSVNFVGRSSTRNGVTAYVDRIDEVEPYKEGNMTIALGGEHLGSCFIQKYPFYTSQNVVVLIPLQEMSENVKLFIAHLIRNESANNYLAFARELNAHVKTDFIIKLPITKSGELDISFINEYISSLSYDISNVPEYFLDDGYEKAFWYIDNIDQDKFEEKYASSKISDKISLSDRKWEPFVFHEIVQDIHNGKAYNKSDLTIADGDDYVSYVTRTNENNGISLCVENKEYDGLEKAKAITIGDTTATIFYQDHDFITGPHIIVIRADWFNVYTANFLISILNKEKYRYPVFGRAFSKDLIKDTIVYLPVKEPRIPDYKFMEDYIKTLSFSCNIEVKA